MMYKINVNVEYSFLKPIFVSLFYAEIEFHAVGGDHVFVKTVKVNEFDF